MPCTPVDPRHWIPHPNLITDERRFGYRGCERKVSFFGLDSPSMPNPSAIQIFHCAPGVVTVDASIDKAWRIKRLDCTRRTLVAPHNSTCLDRSRFLYRGCQFNDARDGFNFA